MAEVDVIVERNSWRRGAALEILEDIQEHFGWVSPAAVRRVAELTDFSASYLYGVVTFYDEFRIAPPGTIKVDVCNGSACALNREDAILHVLEKVLGIQEVTDASPYELFSQNKFGYVTDDGQVLLRKVDCVGACQLAPLFRVVTEGAAGHHPEARYFGPVTAASTESALRSVLAELQSDPAAAGAATHAPAHQFHRGNLG